MTTPDGKTLFINGTAELPFYTLDSTVAPMHRFVVEPRP